MKKEQQRTVLSTELLAPAGSVDAAWAAFHYGANAIYIGLDRFSARAEARNITPDALNEVVGFAHEKNRFVYVTLNTLIQEAELPDLLETIAVIDDLNVDAVIVQDMGVARLIRKHFPLLELHASTQMAVHNLAGAKELADIGFSRVVLARELSLKEIGEITSKCGIETEVFVHGALCYSYSGLCLFSSHVHHRSGNRGKCAYCCRQHFNQDQLPFAMKDLSLASYVDELLDVGVHSLKIEGRMKSPLYVAAISYFYRQLLDGKPDLEQQAQLLSDIQTIFGRASTDLYFKTPESNPIDRTTNGFRGATIGAVERVKKQRGASWLYFTTNRALRKFDGLKVELSDAQAPYGFPLHEVFLQKDSKQRTCFEVCAGDAIAVRLPDDHPYLPPNSTVYCSISQEIRERYVFPVPRPGVYRQRSLVDVHLLITPTAVEAEAMGVVCRSAGIFEAARQPERTIEAVRKCFSKCGNTDWAMGEVGVEDPDSLYVPASVLNELRRNLLGKLDEARVSEKQAAHLRRVELLMPISNKVAAAASICTSGENPVRKQQQQPTWSIRVKDINLLSALTEDQWRLVDEVVWVAQDGLEKFSAISMPHAKLRIALPSIQRDWVEFGLKELGQMRALEVSNLGGLNRAKRAGIRDVTADWPLYSLNSEALMHWQELGVVRSVLSPEDTAENLYKLIAGFSDQVVVPMFQYTPLMVSVTKPESETDLMDRKQNHYRVEKDQELYVLINQSPFSLSQYMNKFLEIGALHFRADFSYGVDSPARAASIFEKLINGHSVADSHCGNMEQSTF